MIFIFNFRSNFIDLLHWYGLDTRESQTLGPLQKKEAEDLLIGSSTTMKCEEKGKKSHRNEASAYKTLYRDFGFIVCTSNLRVRFFFLRRYTLNIRQLGTFPATFLNVSSHMWGLVQVDELEYWESSRVTRQHDLSATTSFLTGQKIVKMQYSVKLCLERLRE